MTRHFSLKTTWHARRILKKQGLTHLASINSPVPGHRRVVAPIWPYPGPVLTGQGSVFQLHTRPAFPFSPFLHCGPCPFSLSARSQGPTESSNSQPTDGIAFLSNQMWVVESNNQSVNDKGGTYLEQPMGLVGQKTAFPDSTRLVWYPERCSLCVSHVTFDFNTPSIRKCVCSELYTLFLYSIVLLCLFYYWPNFEWQRPILVSRTKSKSYGLVKQH